jgi:predicted dehydrogenase
MRVATTSSPESGLGEKSEESVGIGIIGAGRIGQVHAENLAFRIKKGRLVGVASGTKQLAERCSLATGCKPYYDYHLLLEVGP